MADDDVGRWRENREQGETRRRGGKMNLHAILIAKADRLYAELIARMCRLRFQTAEIAVVTTIGGAQKYFLEAVADLFVTGVGFDDGDVLDLLATCTQEPRRAGHVLVVTRRADQRTLAGLHGLAVDGVFDCGSESVPQLEHALDAVSLGRGYLSPTTVERFRNNCLVPGALSRLLTPNEQMVLAVIGDGCDDEVAAEELGLKRSTVESVRRDLHRKLRVRHRGELVRVAVQLGFVRLNPGATVRPGFSTMVSACRARKVESTDAEPDSEH